MSAGNVPSVHLVSLINVIANPQKYDGEYIQVVGYVHLEFEGEAVYLHEEDYLHGLDYNALFLGISSEVRRNPTPYNNKYCLVQGVYHAPPPGDRSNWSGTINNLVRLESWDFHPTK